MCQPSFERAVIAVNQFIKHNMLSEAQTSLILVQRYMDSTPLNQQIFQDIQLRINQKIAENN